MSDQMDLSFMDRPELLEIIFPVVYSSFYLSDYLESFPSNVPTYSIEVEEGIQINCGFWTSSHEHPSILYFHGNGEAAAGHDWIASFYNQRGINLFVTDYRGYGTSKGNPTVSNMISDTHALFKGFREIIRQENFSESLFLMGRSLGSIPAIELAYHYQEEVCGLIIESGSANNFRRLWNYIDIKGKEAILGEQSPFLNKVKIQHVHKPTLIIHGEYDEILPVGEGKELYQSSGSPDKEILIISGAGHNDIMIANQELYFDKIEQFIKAHCRMCKAKGDKKGGTTN